MGLTASFLPLSFQYTFASAEMLGACSTTAPYWSAGNIATFLLMGHRAYEDSGARIHLCVTVHHRLCCFCFSVVAVLMKKCFKLSSSHFESCDYSKVTPISILFGVALDIFKNNSWFEASCAGTSKRERMRCTGSA